MQKDPKKDGVSVFNWREFYLCLYAGMEQLFHVRVCVADGEKVFDDCMRCRRE